MQLTSYKVGNRSEKGVVIISHFDKINATHILIKLGMDQRREWLFLVILTRSMQLTSYKVGNRPEKGVVIISYFDKINATHIL